MKNAKGFTLIELMVVVVVVAILAAIALPSYQSYVRKGKRSVAQSFVSQIALKQEEYFAHMRAYTATIGSGGLGLAEPTEISGLYSYQVCTAACLSLPNFPTGGYIVVAQPVAGSDQANDPVGGIALYSTGAKCTTSQADYKWGNATC
jgi:type IV pilus assembly protein PilE